MCVVGVCMFTGVCAWVGVCAYVCAQMHVCVHVCIPMSFTRAVYRSRRDTDKEMFLPPSAIINYLQILREGQNFMSHSTSYDWTLMG